MGEPDTGKQSRPLEQRARGFRRFLRWTWKAFVVYCMVSLGLSFIPERPLDVELMGDPERVAISGELLAGAAKTVITPPETLWDGLNIYGEAAPVTGIIDDVHVRALTLAAEGAEGRFSIVSVELLVIPPAMRPAA